MRGLMLTILTFTGLFAQTVTISGTCQDLLSNPIDSASVYYYQNQIIVDSSFTGLTGEFNVSYSVVSADQALPKEFELSQNYPNPFNPSTRIDLSVQRPAIFAIYDIRGALVESLNLASGGSYELTWGGRHLGAGLYIYVLRSGHQSVSHKMILLDGGDGSGLAVNQVAYASSSPLTKPATNDVIRFEKSNTSAFEINFATPHTDTTLGVLHGNVGPVLMQVIPDSSVIEGDTLILNWDQYFYNDSETHYESFIYPPPIAGFYNMQVMATDLIDPTLTTMSNIFSVAEIHLNEPPTVSEIVIQPTNPSLQDTLFLSYVFLDPDSGEDMSIKQWYKNGALTGIETIFFPPDSADAGDSVKVTVRAYDGEAFGNSETSNTVAYPMPIPPNVSDLLISPELPELDQDLELTYEFTDPESGDDMSIKHWYKNGELTGVASFTFPSDSADAGDSIRAFVTAYNGNLFGNTDSSNFAVYQAQPDTSRDISGIIYEFFSQLPDSGAQVTTSLGTAITDADGNYTVEAGFNEEHILVLKDGRFESGFIVDAGELDVEYDHEIAKDDSAGGIDRNIFENYIVSNRLNGPPYPEDGKYVSLTAESVPDTVFILGEIIIGGSYVYSQGFQNTDQLNTLAERINNMANQITNGLYNSDVTTIMIADSNFTDSDSIALFLYTNMHAVDNDEFFESNPTKSLQIKADPSVLGSNSTTYEDDMATIKGHSLILGYWLSPDALGSGFDTEFTSSILGGAETPAEFLSVLGPGGGPVTDHDQRILAYIINRGPNHNFPDFPEGFDPDIMGPYLSTATAMPEFSKPDASMEKVNK